MGTRQQRGGGGRIRGRHGGWPNGSSGGGEQNATLSVWGLVHGGKGDEGKNKVDYDDGLGCVIAVLMAFW